MKIIFFAQSCYPCIGGVEKHIFELSVQLAKRNHEIYIIAPKSSKSNKIKENIDKNISILRTDLSKNRYKRRAIYFKFIINHYQLFKNANIIHFHDWVSFWQWGVFIWPLAKINHIKMYITFHGWEGIFPPDKKVIYLRKFIEKLMDGNICIGKYLEKWYNAIPTIISYGGVKTNSLCETNNISNIAVFVGRLEEDTGILSYVLAWKIISIVYPDLQLIICGDGKLMGKIVNTIKEKNIKNIEILGFVKNPERFVQKAKFVFTSGYLGILEAFSYKKPVVSFYDNELKEDYLRMMPCSYLIWIVNNENKTLDAVRDILSKNFDWKMSLEYTFAQSNSWEHVCKQYCALWEIGD
ncbi:glycosyltransferase family 4 protein [Pectinatus frisingensis]|uniref:glycosyltransferase family 4 protein n=1 Tax=Pectinatus frisingensis TaxID=865 RepID=UPI0018C6971E|nr:glycosyltransferase family 4 protein [Pectinatus frisingensis]